MGRRDGFGGIIAEVVKRRLFNAIAEVSAVLCVGTVGPQLFSTGRHQP